MVLSENRPGLFRWPKVFSKVDISIKQQRAEVIIAGGMGPRAIEFFNQLGIEAITGASGRVADVVNSYLKGELKGTKPC